jgi:hypothetical protein
VRYITLKWATSREACQEAVLAFQDEFASRASVQQVLAWLKRIDRPGWLGWVLGQDDLEITKELIKLGADIHAYDDSALRWAADSGHLEVVKFLEEASQTS